MKNLKDYRKIEEVVKHLDKVGGTYDINLENPFCGYKSDYILSLSYLGKEYFRLDTRVFGITIDEMLKESDKE